MLVQQLLLQLPVDELLLPRVLVVDLLYHISSLLGAEVGLVVLLVNLFLSVLHNLGRGNLLLDNCLVRFHVALLVQACLQYQPAFVADVLIEDVFLSLTFQPQGFNLLFMTLQSLQSGLIGYSFVSRICLRGNAMVTQTVVVNGEGALRSKEHWNVSVVRLTDGLPVQSFLNKFSDVPRVLLDVFNVV